MMIQLSAEDIDLEMRRYATESSDGILETEFEWGLGTWTLSKFDKRWRIGWSRPLSEKAQWIAYPFAWHGDSYVGLIFESGGDQPAWYMAGWYHDYNRDVAERLVSFLNDEIADRLAGKISKYNGRVGRGQDLLDAMYAYEDEVEQRRNARGYTPSPEVKALFADVDRELAEKRARQVTDVGQQGGDKKKQ